MKDEFLAAVIMILLMGLFFFNSYAMETKTKRISEIIDTIEAEAEKENISRKDAEKLRKEWEKEKKILLYFSSHGSIREIDECVELFGEYAEMGSCDKALHNLKKARHHLKDLSQREKIRLDNIF